METGLNLKTSEYFKATIVIIFSLGLMLYSQWEAFKEELVVNDDTSQHIFWMHKWGENGFVTEDPILEMSEAIQPWGFIYIYRFFSLFTDPITTSKILPVILFSIFAFFLYKLIQKFYGSTVSLVFCMIVLSLETIFHSFPGGHTRAFALPLLVLSLYLIETRQYYFFILVTLLSSLIYPVIFLVLVATTFVYFFMVWISNRTVPKVAVISVYFLVVFCGFGQLLYKSSIMKDHVGDLFSKTLAMSMPEFGAGGRVPLIEQLENFYVPKKVYTIFSVIIDDIPGTKGIGKTSKAIHMIGITSALLIWTILFFRKRQEIDLLLISIILSGVLLAFASQVLALKLYQPSRYLMYTLPIFFVMLIVRLLLEIPTRHKYYLLTLLLIPFFNIPQIKGFGLNHYDEFRPVYEYFNKLKGKALIAAPPAISDQIPLFTKKSVLFSFEASHAVYFDKYWPKMKQRTYDFWEGYLTGNSDNLKNLVEKYKIDFIVIDNQFLSSLKKTASEGTIYFEPFDTTIRDIIKTTNNKHEVYTFSESSVFQIDERFKVINCAKL